MSNRKYSRICYHFVWATSERKPLINGEWEFNLHNFVIAKCKSRGYGPLAIGGTADHLHVLLSAQPEMIPAVIAENLKGLSMVYINHECPVNEYFSWQDGYGVLSVCPDHVDSIIDYIKNQKHHHKSGSLMPEYEKAESERSLAEIAAGKLKIHECVLGDY